MAKRILMIMLVGMLAACVSGVTPPDTYVGKNGKTTIIETDREMCERSCNEDYSRCMESTEARNNNGLTSPSGIYGASGDCRSDLKHCLPTCRGQ